MGDTSAPTASLVLIVEEETHEREAIADHLRGAGYDVCHAADTDEALASLNGRGDVVAVVTDAHVPGEIDGHELAALVRREWPSIAVILMSGHSDASSGAVPDGAAFVAKPFLLEHIVPTLRRMLG